MRRWTRMALVAGLAAVVVAGLAIGGCGGDKSTDPGGGNTGLELDSPDIGQNGTFSHTFTAAGTFTYHCRFHGFMHGEVDVQTPGPGAPGLANGTISGSAFTPNPIVIGVGGTVTWTNNDGTTHSVTSP